MSLRCLIADDHTLVSEGLEVMLSMAEDVELAGTVSNGQAAMGIFGRIGGQDPDALLGPDFRSKQDPVELTDREKRVLEGMADGLSTREIGARVDLPEETVKINQRFLRQKLGIRYWTEVNPKSILKEFWHRIRKGK